MGHVEFHFDEYGLLDAVIFWGIQEISAVVNEYGYLESLGWFERAR